MYKKTVCCTCKVAFLRTISKRSSECWLLIGHKKCVVLLFSIGEQHLMSFFREFVHDDYWLDHGLSGSCTKEMHAVRKLSVWYKRSISKYCLPENQRRFSKNTSLSLQQVFTLSSITPSYILGRLRSHDSRQPRKRRILKSRADYLKSEFTFIQSLSWFNSPTLSNASEPFWNWISVNHIQVHKEKENLPLLVYVLHETWNWAFSRGSRAVTAKKCTKKRDALAKMLFCLVKLLLSLLPRLRCILNVLLFTIHCDPSETEFPRCKLNCFCW